MMGRKKKIEYTYQVKEKGFLGIPRTVTKKKTVEVDAKTYKELKKRERQQEQRKKQRKGNSFKPYSVEEMMFYDDIFGD